MTPMLMMLKLSKNINLQRFALDKEVYMYERHTYQEMTYDLPIKKGINTIIIKFAEVKLV